MLGGVTADGQITEQELRSLSTWMDEHSHLRGCWPFDELQSVIAGVLVDGRIDKDEHRMLMALFSEFVEYGDHRAVDMPLNEMVGEIKGFCALCPEVAFKDKLFCFTGRSTKTTRRDLAKLVEDLGGKFVPSVRADLDYLIIGGEGNSAWAFACYGRKVEHAMELRREGHPIILVHENDFWDAVADVGL
jgi:NAD-dependent DNA ligase